MSKLLSELDNELRKFLIDTERLPDDFSAYININGNSAYGNIEILNDKITFTSDDIEAEIFIHINNEMRKYLSIDYDYLGNTGTMYVEETSTNFVIAFNYLENLYVAVNADNIIAICKDVTGTLIDFTVEVIG